MGGKAIWVLLEAKEGKEAEVERFLKDGLGLVQKEPDTVSWFALKLGKSSYGIFDTFKDDSGRDTHLSGKVAEALLARASELFSNNLRIDKVDIIAEKLP